MGGESSLALGFIPCGCSAPLHPWVLGIPIPMLPFDSWVLP